MNQRLISQTKKLIAQVLSETNDQKEIEKIIDCLADPNKIEELTESYLDKKKFKKKVTNREFRLLIKHFEAEEFANTWYERYKKIVK